MIKMNDFFYEINERLSHLLKLKLVFGKNYQFFDGHFDEFKLLPALIQLHLIQLFAENYFSVPQVCQNIPNLKFVKPITPDFPIDLELIYNELQKKVDFTFSSQGVLYSSGSLKYE